jgi:hypothetical protein
MYAIIQKAKSEHPIIQTLALVDRSMTKQFWWTSDCPSLVMGFVKKSAAEYSAKKLRGVKVVPYETAQKIVRTQRKMCSRMKEEQENGFSVHGEGWDDHKHS